MDFGTSNSAIGVVSDGRVDLVPFDGGGTTIPSALFFDFESDVVLYGGEAIDAYVSGHEGRLMRAIKSVLGTGLISETTQLKKKRVAFVDVIATFVRHLKTRAERHGGVALRQVVHGRPVHFVDGDPEADRSAEDTLRDIARAAGFEEVVFQYEPIAAARQYERTVNDEQIALVADIGGGTSDVSILRLGPERRDRADRADDILANGGLRLGGTDIDRLLSLDRAMPALGLGSHLHDKNLPLPRKLYSDLASWPRINRLYARAMLRDLRAYHRDAREPEKLARLLRVAEEHQGHRLAMEVEAAKIRLSETAETAIDMALAEPGLRVPVTRDDLLRCTASELERLRACIRACLRDAAVAPDAVDTVILTGGSTLLPAVRDGILGLLPKARVYGEDSFVLVGKGLAEEARLIFGG